MVRIGIISLLTIKSDYIMEDITQEIRAEVIMNRVNLLRVTVNDVCEWKKKISPNNLRGETLL